MKKWTGVSFLFDMRGFWPDDRVEAKLWRDSSLFDQLLHRYYKRVERQLLGEADHVVSLTRRACPTIKIWSGRNNLPITVIPCCADFDFFQPTPGGGALSRDKLNIPEGAFVLSYLGSLGTWYLLSEMLAFFGELLKHRLEARFLMITPKWGKSEEAQWSVAGLDLERYRLIVVSASPEEVPAMLEAADLSICFIQPGPSRQACFPTKIAESLALGIPVLCNTGIGDIEDFSHLACVIPRMDRAAYLEVIENLDEILKPRGTELRALSRASFGLEFAESSYNRVYDELETHSV